MSMATFSEARILISHKGTNRKLCKVFFSKHDASVYIVPYSYTNQYYYGEGKMPANVKRLDLDFTGQFYTEKIPKISLHQTGQVHIRGVPGLAGPVHIPNLENWNGQHLATVLADSFDVLPKYTKKLKITGKTRDILIKWNQLVESGRIVLYADSGSKNFPSFCKTSFRLRRPTLSKNLYVGVGALGISDQNTVIPNPGMVIIAGWDPTKPITSSNQFLYIRGL